MTNEELKELLKGRKSARLVYQKDTKEVLGLFYEWRKENPQEPVTIQSNYGTFEIGDVIFSRSHDKELIKLLGLESLHEAIAKEYRKKQDNLRKKAGKKAVPILDEMEKELKALLKRFNCSLSYSMHGDTYGTYHGYYLHIDTIIDGFRIERELDF